MGGFTLEATYVTNVKEFQTNFWNINIVKRSKRLLIWKVKRRMVWRHSRNFLIGIKARLIWH